MKINVGLMGFGKTGKAVASVLLHSQKTNLQWVIRKSSHLSHRSVPEFLGITSDEPGLIYSKAEFSAKELLEKMPVDVIIDFSSRDGVDYYGEYAARKKITIITAISNYSKQKIKNIQQLAKRTRILNSPNITLGINFLMMAAKVLRKIAPFADVQIIEEHFNKKLETSGTAKIICNHLKLEPDSIKSVRAGGIIGVHEILFGFPFQTVRLKHESITREAFGNGILFAIEQLQSKKVGYYTMEDLMRPYFNLVGDY